MMTAPLTSAVMRLAFSIIALSIAGCAPPSDTPVQKQMVTIQRGDLKIGITADGNLKISNDKDIKLCFGTPGTVSDILIREGDNVKAGTLLAKLDDNLQKIAVTAAQYDVELALNELAERVYPSILGYPRYYPDVSALFRQEQASAELIQAQNLLAQNKYKESVSRLRIALHDLEASLNILQSTITDIEKYPDIASEYTQQRDNPTAYFIDQIYPDIPKAINLLEKDIEDLSSILRFIEQGKYDVASIQLSILHEQCQGTYRTIKTVCGKIVKIGITFHDTSTTIDTLTEVEALLLQMQKMLDKGDYDQVKFAELMHMAQHDLDMTHKVLADNQFVFKHGLNLKALRQANLSLQKAETSLKKAKEDLMKTEILAPFSGMVVSIGLKEGEQLSSVDYSSRYAVHLVDTNEIEVDGVVDEIDIFKVKRGQKALISVDALPGKELPGEVTYISPFGNEKTGVINFKVTIHLDRPYLERSGLNLKARLTATANIIVEEKKNVLLIPNGAIKGSRGDYWTELVVNETKMTTEKRQIVIGLQNGLVTEVISGVKEGDKVVLEKARSSAR
jgi:RND family efflux transporter MFP subunit